MTRSPEYDDRTDEAYDTVPVRGAATVLEPNEARQGSTHHNMRFVLAISLTGAVVLMGITWLSFFGPG